MVLLVNEQKHGVVTLTLNRPEKANALNATLIYALTEFFSAVPKADWRVLVMAGSGKHFCAGADLHWMLGAEGAGSKTGAAELAGLLQLIFAYPLPLIVEAKGAVRGGALGLLACADIVLAESASTYAFSETRLGLIPATISPYVLTCSSVRLLKPWFLSGAVFDVEQAKGLNLVHAVAADEGLIQLRDFWLQQLLMAAPEAQQCCKQWLRKLDVFGIESV